MGRESQVRTLALNLTLLALKMWAYSPQNRQNRCFLVTICRKGVCPLNGFLSNLAWGRVSQDCTLVPKLHFSAVALNVGLEPSKSQKLVICGIYWPKWVYPLKQFLQNLAWGRVPQVPTVVRTFTIVARPPKSEKIAIFGINLPPRKNYGGP